MHHYQLQFSSTHATNFHEIPVSVLVQQQVLVPSPQIRFPKTAPKSQPPVHLVQASPHTY